MLPAPFTYSKSRLALSQHLEARSAALPPTTRTRTLKKTGAVQEYEVRASIISDGAEKTGWALVRAALATVAQVRQVPALAGDYDAATPPPLSTNSEALCRAQNRGRRVSARTVRNHLAELEAAGVITKRKFRGRRHDFQVWINPEFLWNTAGKAAEAPVSGFQKSTAYDAITPVSGTNFPPKEVHELLATEEIETGPVDKLLGVPAQAAGQATPSGYAGLPAKPGTPARGQKKAAGGAAAPAPAPTPPAAQAPASGPKSALAQRQADMCRELWWAAQREIYGPADRRFTDEQSRKALKAIWYGVYGGFADDFHRIKWERYHEQALERIGLAAGYFRRNPEKYAPTPWAEHTPGTGYFDSANERGFQGTLAWYTTHLAHRLNRASAEGLRRARRELRQHTQGTAPKRVQAKTYLDLFRYHEDKFRRMGEQALNRFYQHFSRPVVA